MYIFLSPHFDDAIGSCGCWMYDLRKQNEKVEIVTVFAGERPETISPFAKELLELWGLENGVNERIQENEMASLVLGVTNREYPFVEAIYRMCDGDWLYPKDGDIFEELAEVDNYISEELMIMLCENYSKNDTFVFPSARGKHVDHILVKRTGEKLHKKGYSVLFYNDFSYDGQNKISYDNQELIMEFSQEHLDKKIESMLMYKSQLGMLFETIGIHNYYRIENKMNDKIFEKYYVII